MTPIFRWSGEYVGFVDGPFLFGADGRYLGWHEADGSVWRADGRPLGWLVDGAYVLRDLRRTPPVPRCARVPPVPATPPPRSGARLARVPRPGWVDALQEVGRPPAERALCGRWCAPDAWLELAADGRFAWAGTGEVAAGGTWRIEGWLLRLEVQSGEAAPAQVGLAVIELEGDRLTLRRTPAEGRSLPFTLRRAGSGTGPA